jgi:hypothetical protein
MKCMNTIVFSIASEFEFRLTGLNTRRFKVPNVCDGGTAFLQTDETLRSGLEPHSGMTLISGQEDEGEENAAVDFLKRRMRENTEFNKLLHPHEQQLRRKLNFQDYTKADILQMKSVIRKMRCSGGNAAVFDPSKVYDYFIADAATHLDYRVC